MQDAPSRDYDGNEIAIVGASVRLPGAPDLETFWQNLRAGVESISFFSDDELEPSPLLPEALRARPDFVRAGGVLEGADLFDYDFFGIAPREARWMDPQQRVFLETAWSALEDAGYDPAGLPGKVALYAGAAPSLHALSLLDQVRGDPASLFEAFGASGAESLATKASFRLGLRGESVSIYTACSTGLAVVHLACQSLLLRQSDVAVAGAVRVSLPQKTGYLYQEGMIFSPDGRCRAFDRRAGGTVLGQGAAAVVLKPLEDALRDGDPIRAVIRATALNNDGRQKAGYTAPSVEGQADVIREALAYAGLGPDAIGYLEAHGTGTPLGDPIEVAALARVFGGEGPASVRRPLGSVKTNVGHLDAAAGLVGLIKAMLVVGRGEVPPSLHFEEPNPAADFARAPFFVNTKLHPWPRSAEPRRAGVSSFGIGGTNAHAVVEEPPAREATGTRRPNQLVTISARTPSALDAMARELGARLAASPETPLADVAFTRAVGRKAFAYRRTLVAPGPERLAELLEKPRRGAPEPVGAEAPGVAFLFPGQGAQSSGMARALWEAEPDFKRALEACFEALDPGLARELRPLLCGPPRGGPGDDPLAEPELGLPALFAVEYSLARLWQSWGVTPAAALGHSFGEYAAACVAGVFSLEGAIGLASLRGRLMSRLPPGRMLAVAAPEALLGPLLERHGLSLAAVNGEGRCVASGHPEAIGALELDLRGRGVASVLLPVRHAFHSPDVEPLLGEIEREVSRLSPRTPELPLVSSATGDWFRGDEATRPSYWARQMRATVRFAGALDTLLGRDLRLWLEAGPDRALSALGRQHGGALALASLARRGQSEGDHAALLEAAGALWERGVTIDWGAFYAHERRQRVSLPPYPFERKHCGADLSAAAASEALSALSRPPSRAPSRAPSVAPSRPLSVAPSRLPSVTPSRAPSQSPPQPSGWPPAGALPETPTVPSFDAPRDEIERVVMEIWRERLGEVEFGIHDNFLELGGNSLMAAQLLTRLREAFRVQLPLGALFEAPTVAGVAARIAALAGAGEGARGARPLGAATGARPLSVVQERVLKLERHDSGNPALHMAVALDLEGELDADALERALGEVVRRHEALRTTYVETSGGFEARVEPPSGLALGSEDAEVSTWPERARAEVGRPFDLGVSPVRAVLLRASPLRHALLVTVHHVVSDTLSMVALVREMAANYAAFVEGGPPPLPPLGLQYADYAAWQRAALAGGDFASQADYWRRRLEAAPGPLDLPSDRPRRGGVRGARIAFRLSAELGAATRAFGRREGATAFMILLAAFEALLARATGADDLVVGTPVGNRDRGELEPLIGYVAHALPLRTDLAGDPDFRELVARVKETTLEAYANADMPYEWLVRELEPRKAPERERLFDALFVLHGPKPAELTAPGGLRLRLLEVPGAPAQFGVTLAALAISLGETEEGGFAGGLEYATDLFDAATAERLVCQLEALLTAALAEPARKLSSLPLGEAPRAEAEPLQTPAVLGSPLARLESLAEVAPDAGALRVGGQALTRRELVERARGVAEALRARRVGAGARIYVALPPSAERWVVALGALAAGAAYAPLDPARLGAPLPELEGAWLVVKGALGGTSGAVGVLTPAALEAEGRRTATNTRLDARDTQTDAPAWAEGGPGHFLSYYEFCTRLAMLDARLGRGEGGRWLAFGEPHSAEADLEAAWALGRGLEIVLAEAPEPARFLPLAAGAPTRALALSLSYFANDEDALGGPKYRLLLEGAKVADRRGLRAVWTPERHFHSFGGLYPSPAAVGAALAAATERVLICAGSVVMPLHDPVRVAEDWSVIDNLSGGRAGVSFASGWNANDFIFAPERYARRKEVMLEGLQTVLALWRGEAVRRTNGAGEAIDVRIRPRPLQKELPFWLTAAGSPETFRLAGELGAGVLTNLMGQRLDDLGEKIALYREAFRRAGRGPGRGHVTLMMHAFLGGDEEGARRAAREPLARYFRSSIDILRGFAAMQGLDLRGETLGPADIDALVEHGIGRYLDEGGLFGTPEGCEPMVERVRGLDVDELAALVDFGVGVDETIAGIERLGDLRDRIEARTAAGAEHAIVEARSALDALADLIASAGATHLRCDVALVEALVRGGRTDALSSVLVAASGELPAPEAWAKLCEAASALTLLAPDPRFGRALEARAGRWVLDAPEGFGPEVLDDAGRPLPAGIIGWVRAPGGERRRARRRGDGAIEFVVAAARAERRLQGSPAAAQAGPPPLRRTVRGGPLPLSFAQQRLWYLDQLEPGNIAYNNAVAFRLSGELDAAALERALGEVVRRHEALRTTFAVTSEGPVQVVAPAASLALARHDVRGASTGAEARAAEIVREAARTPFDLGRGPLARATLVRLAEAEYVLGLTLHHIVSDGWSAGVLATEIVSIYLSAAAEVPPPLPELPVQYADYAVWQRDWAASGGLEGELAYWQRVLDGVPPLELPFDRPRGAMQSQRGAREKVVIGTDLLRALAAFGRRAGATPFMVLAAALKALCHRYSGQTDVALGTPVAGRNRPELEPLVGCFINTIVLRTDLSGDPSFAALIARVRETTLAALAHQDAPFERVVDALGVPRDLSHTPVFQAMLVLHNTPSPTVELPGLTLRSEDVDTGAAKLDLTLELRETAAGLEGVWEYNADLFDAATVAQLSRHFVRLLAAAIASPECALSELTLLDESEETGLLEATTAALPAAGETATLAAAFEARVRRSPGAIALRSEGEGEFSYAELNARANRIARRLRSAGVGPEARVAVVTGRPAETIAAFLGVLKAGGAYAPLDPVQPAERLASLLADLEPLATLAPGGWVPPQGAKPEPLAFDEIARAGESEGDLAPSAGDANAAYVLFTSGSGGRPKGVVVEHRNVLASTQARTTAYGEVGRCLSLPPLTFDASAAGLYWALLGGGTLCYPAAETREDPRLLARFIAAEAVTHLIAVPAMYEALLAAAAPGQLGSLATIIVGGEACPAPLVSAHHGALPRASLFNEYGPTEATIWSTSHRTTPEDSAPVPIGRPAPGVSAYVLNAQLRLVPWGAPGELYVGGQGVARGYLGAPALSAERFVSSPFRPGERLHRTGDRVRLRRDGELEFLGRVDRQVKIRGQRVEPGELEAALATHPRVHEAYALSHAPRGGRPRLVTFVTISPGGRPEGGELRDWLRTRLPEALVPAACVVLDALPRTPNGKVDARALAALAPEPLARADAPEPARSDVEARLVAILREVLAAPAVGVHDDFFELGGDSILSIQVVTRARQAGIEITPRQVFQHPTAAGLAAVAGTRLTGNAEQGPIEGPLPLTPAQRWFFELGLPNRHHWNMSLALELTGEISTAVLERALGQVLEHHDALRLRFSRAGERWHQVNAAPSGGPPPFERIDLSTLSSGSREAALEAALSSLQGSLDLEHGPLFRAALVRQGESARDLLVFVAHHLVVDGVSWRVLLEDFALACRQLVAGGAAHLPPKTTSFRAWAQRLVEHADSAALRDELPYWVGQEWEKSGHLPRSGSGADNLEGRGVEERVSLSPDETRALLRDATRALDARPQELMLGALAGALGTLTGSSFALVDVETHGRAELFAGLDVSRTVGWFTAFYPALLLARGEPEALARAAKVATRAVPGGGIGYGLLRYLCGDAAVRDALGALPRAEIAFNYLGQIDSALPAGAPAVLSTRAPGPQRAPEARRPYLLNVDGAVQGGRLELVFSFSPAILSREAVARAAGACVDALRSFAAGRSAQPVGPKPEDFPLAKVSRAQLDKLGAKFAKKVR